MYISSNEVPSQNQLAIGGVAHKLYIHIQALEFYQCGIIPLSYSNSRISRMSHAVGKEIELLHVGASNSDNTSINEAKAVALSLGPHEVVKARYKYIQVEGASMIIVDAMNGKIQALWQVDFIVNDITMLIETTTSISFHHIFRERNVATD